MAFQIVHSGYLSNPPQERQLLAPHEEACSLLPVIFMQFFTLSGSVIQSVQTTLETRDQGPHDQGIKDLIYVTESGFLFSILPSLGLFSGH